MWVSSRQERGEQGRQGQNKGAPCALHQHISWLVSTGGVFKSIRKGEAGECVCVKSGQAERVWEL